MKSARNPFYAGTFHGIDTFIFNAEDRKQRVHTFSIEECEAALKLDLQKSVRQRIESRLKELKKRKGAA